MSSKHSDRVKRMSFDASPQIIIYKTKKCARGTHTCCAFFESHRALKYSFDWIFLSFLFFFTVEFLRSVVQRCECYRPIDDGLFQAIDSQNAICFEYFSCVRFFPLVLRFVLLIFLLEFANERPASKRLVGFLFGWSVENRRHRISFARARI